MFFLNLRYITAVLAVTGITFALAPQPAEAELVGLVKRVVSDVYGTPPGFDREEKLPRFPVVQDELLETGKDSAMLVEFLDKTTLTLGAGSRLTIDTMVYDPKSHDGTLVLNLSVGVLRFISGKMVNAGVRIVTPTANIGIRGSDALIIVLPDGSTTVNVFSGEFEISGEGSGDQATVGPAQSVSVSAVGAVGAVGPGLSDPPDSPGQGSAPGGVGGDPGIGGEDPIDPTGPSGPGGGGNGNGGHHDDDDHHGWTYDPGAPPSGSPSASAGPGGGSPGGGSPEGGNGDHPDDHNGHNGNGNGGNGH